MATEQFRRKKVLIGKNKVWSYIRQDYDYKLDKMNYSLVIGEGTFYKIRNINPKENLLDELSNKRESILYKMNNDVKNGVFSDDLMAVEFGPSFPRETLTEKAYESMSKKYGTVFTQTRGIGNTSTSGTGK